MSAPVVSVVVRAGPALHAFLRTPEAALLERAIASDLTLVLERLGIPGTATVEIRPGRGPRLVRITVDGKLVPYSPSTMLRSWLAVSPAELQSLPLEVGLTGSSFPDGWLALYLGSDYPDKGELTASWLERLVYHSVIERPSVLLGRDQIVAFAAGAPRLKDRELRPLLAALLDHGVSIADRSLIARELVDGRQIGRPSADTVEACFADLRSHVIEICVSPATLVQLLGVDPPSRPASVYELGLPEAQQLFQNMEETFFSSFGFHLPDVVWAPTPGMAERSVGIRLGEWSGIAVTMPPPGYRLVNAAPDTLLPQLESAPAVHPVFGTPCALIEDDPVTKHELESRGVVTWGPIDFVILNLYGELTRRPHRLFGVEDLEYELAQLELFDFHASVSAALAHYTLGDLTRVCRALLAEGLSLKDLPSLLERMAEFDVVEVESADLDVLDDRLPVPLGHDRAEPTSAEAVYAYLRRRLAATLSRRSAWYGTTIVAYTLEAELEREAAGWAGDPPTDARAEAFRNAVWRELQSASRLPFGQVIVTSDRARAGVRAVLAPELFELPVLGRGELLGDVEVRTLATIAAP